MASKLRDSIGFQLGLWFLFIAIIPSALFVSYYHFSVTSKLNNKISQQVKELTNQNIIAIEDYIKSVRDDLNLLTKNPLVSHYITENVSEDNFFFNMSNEAYIESFREYLKNFSTLKEFKNIYIIDDGMNIRLNLNDDSKEGRNLIDFGEDSPLVNAIKNINYFMQFEISNFGYCQLEGELVAFIVVPILDESKIIGYFAVSMSEEMIFSKIFKFLVLNNKTDVFIGSKNYFKAFYLKSEKIFKEDKTPLKAFEDTLNGHKVFEKYQFEQSNFLVISTYLPSFKWGVVFRIPIDDTSDNSGNNLIVIFTISLIFLILLSILLVIKFVSLPIKKLIAQIKLIEQGDFDKKLSLHSTNEFSIVENSFNSMVDEIKDYKDNLENKVTIRTKELTDAKIELTKYKNELEAQVELEVAKRREQEKLLLKQSKFTAVSEIISSIAHQWRQPLNAISIMVMDLEYNYYNNSIDKDLIDDFVDKISSQLQYMSNTIDNFRDFFKMSTYKEFMLDECFDGILSIVSVELKYYSINLVFDNKIDRSIKMFGYENEFKQAFLNILTNSKDAILDAKNRNLIREGEIRISLFADDKEIFIDILDNGIGIDNSLLDKIFLPYFSTKSQAVGIGLGLYLTKIVIDSMQGDIKVISKPLHTLFKITLPRRSDG